MSFQQTCAKCIGSSRLESAPIPLQKRLELRPIPIPAEDGHTERFRFRSSTGLHSGRLPPRRRWSAVVFGPSVACRGVGPARRRYLPGRWRLSQRRHPVDSNGGAHFRPVPPHSHGKGAQRPAATAAAAAAAAAAAQLARRVGYVAAVAAAAALCSVGVSCNGRSPISSRRRLPEAPFRAPAARRWGGVGEVPLSVTRRGCLPRRTV